MSASDERKNRGPTPLGEILDHWLEKAHRETLAPTHRVGVAWRKIAMADPRLTATRLASYRNGTVTIEVQSPPLCSELAQFRRQRLLDELRRELQDDPPTRELRFRLGAF